MPGTTKGTSTDLKTILDTTDEAVRALEALGRPTDHWNDWLVHIVVERLDNYSRVAWEVASQDTPELPTYTQLSSFLEARIQAWSAIHLDKPATKSSSSTSSDLKRRSTTSTNQASTSIRRPSRNRLAQYIRSRISFLIVRNSENCRQLSQRSKSKNSTCAVIV